jgi:hypothetical protein
MVSQFSTSHRHQSLLFLLRDALQLLTLSRDGVAQGRFSRAYIETWLGLDLALHPHQGAWRRYSSMSLRPKLIAFAPLALKQQLGCLSCH